MIAVENNIKDYVSVRAFARSIGLSKTRLFQLITELEQETGQEVGTLIGTVRLLSKGEQQSLLALHSKKRGYHKVRKDQPLTKWEREALSLTADGFQSSEIAERLHCGPSDVKSHLLHARQKLCARTNAHAVAIAMRRGLL